MDKIDWSEGIKRAREAITQRWSVEHPWYIRSGTTDNLQVHLTATEIYERNQKWKDEYLALAKESNKELLNDLEREYPSTVEESLEKPL